ncbi:MAG: hypothetical protein WBR28_10430 [Mycobacterium sp.]
MRLRVDRGSGTTTGTPTLLSGARTIGPSPATGLPDDPLAALNVLRWAAGLEPLQSDDVD